MPISFIFIFNRCRLSGRAMFATAAARKNPLALVMQNPQREITRCIHMRFISVYFKMIFLNVKQIFPFIILPNTMQYTKSCELVLNFTCKLMRFGSISTKLFFLTSVTICERECNQSGSNDFLLCKGNDPKFYSNS